MKHVRAILSHLKNDPSLMHLKKSESYQKLLGLLPKSMAQGVRFMYNKNDTLFFVLEHPGLKMEFHYKTTLIKGLLKELIAHDPSCRCIEAQHIQTFVTNKPPLHVKPSAPTGPFYSEASKGAFVNHAASGELHSLFESIRKTIQCSQPN
ncbi:hypothetical protein JWV37_02505 [Sulfurospirillum sp. T05]|uniref:DUF721 domain-containing protein n=1 Tax=Sulfurospirillum tamanense TaxID=2813362 RepID=A0ABS2WQG6_9BACT|nr:hypothetical protein [Sulfurospirillum tamanensis]MBN2963638.1 hypothetical protein [Sulfurospirillum tamanensis]